jgi:predicted acylesterase/phospholipase RssA
MRARALILPLLLLAALAPPVRAQHSLVLGGGGSRGLAHAGALVALEELGYDIPVVVGTSMGAIVGALYAAGYEPERIRSIITDEQWLVRFSTESVPVGPRREPRRPLLVLGLGSRRAPEGLVLATGVNQRLVELLFDAGVQARNDFDRMPRRFRAVAADMATGEVVVLAGGDLPRAVRASMSVPGAFAPVPWGDGFLIDGGVANNLPVSVARATADLPVIAIDVVRPLPEIPERNPLDVGVRALRLLIANAQPDDTPPPELLVVPRIRPGFSEGRFPADPSRLLQAGYDAVREQLPAAPVRAPHHGPRTAAPASGAALPRVAAVRADVADPALRRLVTQVMASVTGPYDPARIVSRTAGLYDSGLFQAVWPRLEFADDSGAAVLVVEATPMTRTGIAAAAQWDGDAGAGAWATLRHRLTFATPVELLAGGIASELAQRVSADASVFSSLVPGMIWNAGAHRSEEQIRRFRNDEVIGRDGLLRTGAWLGAERRGDWFLSALLRHEHVRDSAADYTGWSTGPSLLLARSERPDAVTGVPPLLHADWRFGEVAYLTVRGRAGADRAVGRVRTAAFVEAAASSNDAPRDVLPAATRLLLPWLPTGALGQPRLLVLGLDAAYPIPLDGYVRARFRVAASGTHQADLDERGAWRGGAEFGAVWPTMVGRLEIGYAAGAGGSRLNIGIGSAP